MMKSLFAAVLLALFIAACADPGAGDGAGDTTAAAQDSAASAQPSGPLAAIVQQDDRFGTLATALDSAGLADTLRTGGPFTLFAPTDAAFEALPQGTLAQLLLPDNRERLQTILRYHIAEGSLTTQTMRNNTNASTLEGNPLPIRTSGDALLLGSEDRQVSITETDVQAANGVLHATNAVLMPPTPTP